MLGKVSGMGCVGWGVSEKHCSRGNGVKGRRVGGVQILDFGEEILTPFQEFLGCWVFGEVDFDALGICIGHDFCCWCQRV